jgi:hypothetical protein
MAEDCEKMVQLVKHIENHPCLFDYNRAEYSNDTVKTAASGVPVKHFWGGA